MKFYVPCVASVRGVLFRNNSHCHDALVGVRDRCWSFWFLSSLNIRVAKEEAWRSKVSMVVVAVVVVVVVVMASILQKIFF